MPITMEPLTVQSGLLNIKEDDGPTIRLLCNANIIPSISNMRPVTPNDLPMYFSFIKLRHAHVQKRYPSWIESRGTRKDPISTHECDNYTYIILIDFLKQP
jgi:hypothetical protein